MPQNDYSDASYQIATDARSSAPTDEKPKMLVYGRPEGLREQGNIDLNDRPVVQNADGSHSTEYSTSFGTRKGEVLVPTVVNGKFLTPDGKKPPEGSPEEKTMLDEARKHYEQTGEHMGIFDTPEHSDVYAGKVHNRGSLDKSALQRKPFWK